MSDTAAPFHYDIVGSFLRPEKLKTARAQFAEGAISPVSYTHLTLPTTSRV